MKTINIPNHIQYLGVDIVDHVVARNQKKYSKPNVKFETVNTVEELPKYKGDLLIVKDVLQHWNKDQIFFAIKNIIPNFKYAIIVNSIDLPFRTDLNAKRGDTRTLDLKKAPFSMDLEHIIDYNAVTGYDLKRIYLYKRSSNLNDTEN